MLFEYKNMITCLLYSGHCMKRLPPCSVCPIFRLAQYGDLYKEAPITMTSSDLIGPSTYLKLSQHVHCINVTCVLIIMIIQVLSGMQLYICSSQLPCKLEGLVLLVCGFHSNGTKVKLSGC